MKTTTLLLAFIAFASASTEAKPALSKLMVDEINALENSWEAHMSPRFEGRSIDDVKALCGTIIDPEKMDTLPAKKDIFPIETEFFADTPIPTTFDAREAWPECKKVIGHVRDQARCGSCWAFSSTEAFNDRLCIASNGEFQKLLSPQDTVNCCGRFNCGSMGCNGGQPANAWKWFTKAGVVTGGDFGDNGKGDSCLPYQYHGTEATPHFQFFKCKKHCKENDYTNAYLDDKHMANSAYSLETVEEMQRDIMTYGPISSAFIVYEDFTHYKGGVYSHVSGQQLGGHAIKVIGWGTDEITGEDYWLIMNSWDTVWGEKGLFRMKRGVDECGIETLTVSAGHVAYSPQKME